MSGDLTKRLNQSYTVVMRVKLSSSSRNLLSSQLKSLGVSNRRLAGVCGVSIRTISSWKSGHSTIPHKAFKILTNEARLNQNDMIYDTVEDWWNNSAAGKKGSYERTRKHGPLGTPEGRQKGGQTSYGLHGHNPSSIFARKQVRVAMKDQSLAEFIGILIGDGGITAYQVEVTTNSQDDREYSQFIANLIVKIFAIKPSLRDRKDSKCTRIVISSKELVNQLLGLGLKQGHKLNQGLDVPGWVKESHELMRACLRGIFDTDGSVYQEVHRRNGKKYCYIRLSFVSMSPQLLETIHRSLLANEINAKIRGNRSVNIEQREHIDRYFEIVGSNNPKHLRRYKRFGGVG